VARAFGADKVEVIGEKDESIENTVNTMNKQWGKGAGVEFFDSWRKRITHYKKKGFTSVHLTMYGLPVQETEQAIRKFNKLLVIIGSQKVEKEVYEMADYNVSVTLQPHSEIAAMAVFLDRLQEGKELAKKFGGAKISIEPVAKGKKVNKK
tara:strand:- start:19992 stop:20444 length:453 start_codon:yes stop_codon:yes gene_type:complete